MSCGRVLESTFSATRDEGWDWGHSRVPGGWRRRLLGSAELRSWELRVKETIDSENRLKRSVASGE